MSNENKESGRVTRINPNAYEIGTGNNTHNESSSARVSFDDSASISTSSYGARPTKPNRSAEQHHTHALLTIGSIVDNSYAVLDTIDTEGGEACVYVATDVSSNEKVCLKIYNRVANIKMDSRNILKDIKHKNIAELRNYGWWNEQFYEVWKLYDGRNLGDVIPEASISEDLITNTYLPQMLIAIRKCHENEIVHQDIKPSNFILMNDNTLVLVDFGICARKEGERTHVTQVGRTKDYSAPEVLISDFCWEASDYYSLGVSIYEMLLQTTPYADYDENMALRKLEHLRANYIPGIDKVSTRMQDIIRGLLQYDSEVRWGYDAVHAWLNGDYGQYKVRSDTYRASSSQVYFDFNRERYLIPSRLHDLVEQMAVNWNKGISLMDSEGRLPLLRDRLARIDDELWAVCNVAQKGNNQNYAFFRKLYELDSSLSIFVWRGYCADSAQMLGCDILTALWHQNSNDMLGQHNGESVFSNVAVSFRPTYYNLIELVEDFKISQYLRFRNELSLAAIVEEYEGRIISGRKNGENLDIWFYRIAYSLSGSTELYLCGHIYKDKDAFVEYVNSIIQECKDKHRNAAFDNLCSILYNNKKLDPGFVAWAESIGYAEEIKTLDDTLKGAYS